jgi:hypothetical protein
MTAATIKERLDAADPVDLWPEPRPLPGGRLPVQDFAADMLPTAFKPWVEDVAEGMQTPPEFVAVPAMIAAGSVIGRKVAIRPMQHDDWQEVPNLWGCIVGRPGVIKSPAVKAALKPMARLEVLANEEYQSAKRSWDAEEDERALRKEARKKVLKKRLDQDPTADVSDLRGGEDEEPVARR